MSMLSKQVDELRMLAGDGSMEFVAGPIRASVLLDAADTIEGLRDRLQAVDDTCSIEWRDESYDNDAGREHDGAYFCTKCMADLPQPLQECWDDYQALVADYGNVPPWDKKPFRCCPNCGREVVDA